MCLILLAWQTHPEYSLVVAANRDEYFRRPTAPAQFWADEPKVLAGRDLEQGGTWLGVNTSGRFAALTNFRHPRERRPDAPSRGALVRNFLSGTDTPAAYMSALDGTSAAFNGFNLLAGDTSALWAYSNRGGAPHEITPGVHGLSNHLMNTPWPKVTRGTAGLQELVRSPRLEATQLLELLDDTEVIADHHLPDTGVGLERERQLSAVRIATPGYGTRCSTVLLVGRDGIAEFVERSFAEDGSTGDTVSFSFSLQDVGAPASS